MSAPASAWERATRVEDGEGFVVEDVAFGEAWNLAAVEEAAMPRLGVLAEADVGDDHELRHASLELAYRALDDAIRVEVLRADGVLRRRETEEKDRGNAGSRDGFCLAGELVDRPLEDAGHRGYLVPDLFPVGDEKGIDEIVGGEDRLPDHAPDPCIQPEPSRSLRTGNRALFAGFARALHVYLLGVGLSAVAASR